MDRWVSSVSSLIVGYILADVVVGLFHYLEDNHGTPETPYGIGRYIIGPNRKHHFYPREMVHHAWYYTISTTSFFAFLVWWLILGLDLWWFPFFFWLSISNQVHKWSHMTAAERPEWVTRMQEWGIFQRPEVHRKHHRPPNNSHYCVISNLELF